MTATIRRATVADLPWLRLLFTSLIAHGVEKYPSPYPTMDDEEFDKFTLAMFRQLDRNPSFVCFVADEGGTLTGFLAGEIWERAVGKPNRYVAPHYLFVMPTARGKGIAPALIKAGVAWAKEQGVTHAELAAWPGDDTWRRYGFEPYLAKFWLPLDQVGVKRGAPRGKPAPAPVVTRARRRKKPRMNGHALEAS